MMEGIQLLYQNGILFIFAFAVGASVGSFLNVVIHRWPLEMSIVRPGSHCPSCETPIPWYWNLPVVSWIILRGKCRWCGARISVRYMLVEIAGGCWAVAMLWQFGPGLEFFAYFAFGAALLAGSVIDIHHRLLPDVITLGSVPFGVAMAFLPRAWVPLWPVTRWESIIGVALGSGLFLFVLLIFKYFTGREGMGLGDVKLMAGIGAFMGYPALPAVIFFASLTGIVTWLLLYAFKMADREYQLAFGPFLSAATMAVIVLRPWLEKQWVIIHWV